MVNGFFGITTSKDLFQKFYNYYDDYLKKMDDYSLFLLVILLNSIIDWLKKELKEINQKSALTKKIFRIKDNVIGPLANQAKHRENRKNAILDKSGAIYGESTFGGPDPSGENHRINKEYVIDSLETVIQLLSEYYDIKMSQEKNNV